MVVISSVTALVILYPTLTGNSAQNQNDANTSLQKQFDLSIAYAYVGEIPPNSSYISKEGTNMSIVSQYASSVILKSTRLPGVQVVGCDAEIEIYNIQVVTDTNQSEKFSGYFVGTNYNPSFSNHDLGTMLDNVKKLTDWSHAVNFGSFKFNMTNNESVLSGSIGSIGMYTSLPSNQGLWSAGKPNTISVTVQRAGYLTISSGTISLHKDASNNSVTAMANLSNYGTGFLYNDLVPESKLQTIDLFHPILPTS
jgi:hypothetical protein